MGAELAPAPDVTGVTGGEERSMGQTDRSQEILRRLAIIDEGFVDDHAGLRLGQPASQLLDPKTAALVRVGALVAAESPAVSLAWGTTRALAHLEAAVQAAEALGMQNYSQSVSLGIVLRAQHDPGGARSTLQEALRTGRRIGDKWSMAEAMEGLACLAGDLGDWHKAVVLRGAAQALLDQTGAPWPPDTARYRQESLDQAGAALGDEQFQRAYARGMALSFDQAISLALNGISPST
jgi:hypothetical protein